MTLPLRGGQTIFTRTPRACLRVATRVKPKLRAPTSGGLEHRRSVRAKPVNAEA